MKKRTQNIIIAVSLLAVVGLAVGFIRFINDSTAGGTPVNEPTQTYEVDIPVDTPKEEIVTETTVPVDTTAPLTYTTRATTRKKAPKETTAPATEATIPADTLEEIVQTLAPVHTLSESQRAVMEEKNIDVKETTATAQTTPPPEAQMKPDETTRIDGVKYVWHPIFGWVRDSEDG
ncbi:MAG: hypothetical protein LBR74_05585, partial [Eubacterium sp.]|nr:hypothetical protein [Eubacterium sp.]